MTWYQRSNLFFGMCRNFTLGPKQLAQSPLPPRWSFLGSRCAHQGPFKHTPNRLFPSARNRAYMRCCTGVVFYVMAVTVFYHSDYPFSLSWFQRVSVSSYVQKKLEEYKLQKILEEFKGCILPFEHPDTARVRLIAKNVHEEPFLLIFALAKPSQSAMPRQYSDFIKGEVIVIDRPIVSVSSYAGKIVIFTGLLNCLESDAEIATVISHEVGHALAGRTADMIILKPVLACLKRFASYFTDPTVNGPRWLKCLQRADMLEKEAYDMGLLLMASAGYDPFVAPIVYKKLSGLMATSDYCSKAELFAQAQVPELAMKLYKYKARRAGSKNAQFFLLQHGHRF